MTAERLSTESAHTLDDLEVYERLDPHGMGALIAGLGDQVREAWAAGRAWEAPASFTTPERVVVVGMGGSAIGADIAATIARIGSQVPVEVVRDYAPPPAGPGTLIVGSSVSGNTEETLAGLEAARGAPGMRLAITTGGKLAQFDGPLLQFSWEGHPRAALGWGLMPLSGVLTGLGVLSIGDDEVESDGHRPGRERGGMRHRSASGRQPGEAESRLRLQGRLPVVVGRVVPPRSQRGAGQASSRRTRSSGRSSARCRRWITLSSTASGCRPPASNSST